MRIKFIEPDPRAGTIAQMDSSRGRQLIEAGNAVEVKGDDAAGAAAAPAAAAPAGPGTPDPATFTVAELKASLDAKGVTYPATAKKPDLVALLSAQGA